MIYLAFELSEGEEGVSTLEAVASTSAANHARAMTEAQQVLDWAWRCFPHSHGPIDEGMDWDHDLQVQVEAGDWHQVALTLTGSARFVDAFRAAFGEWLL